MDDTAIQKRQEVVALLYRECHNIMRLLPRDSYFDLADELVTGFENQSKQNAYLEDTQESYAIECTRHRFAKLVA